jgi:hypothetical protein
MRGTSFRPLKLDDKVLVSAHMGFWSRIKKVCCSSFLKKSHAKIRVSSLTILRQVTFRGIPPISLPGIVCLSAHAFQYMLWCLGCMNIDSRPRFMLISCLCLNGSLGLKIDPCVNSQECWKWKDERWKLTKFPHCFLKIGWQEPYNLISSPLCILHLTRQLHTSLQVPMVMTSTWHPMTL